MIFQYLLLQLINIVKIKFTLAKPPFPHLLISFLNIHFSTIYTIYITFAIKQRFPELEKT